MNEKSIGWLSIVRLGLAQTALGAIVVLTTSTLNRVMVVELALPALIPGLLVGIHYAVQLLRPHWGHASDVGGRRTPWIMAGMAALSVGGLMAAVATALMSWSLWIGISLAILAFVVIGIGVGAAGTSLLVLLAKRVAPERRAAAATIVWVMMIAGFIVTAAISGHFLDPFSSTRLVAVASVISFCAFLLSVVAVWGVEGDGHSTAQQPAGDAAPPVPFREALADAWKDEQARRFTIFVFVSMLAYSAQDLILEPFAGLVFALTPGQTTQLSGLQHAGVLTGMGLVAILTTLFAGSALSSLKLWTIGGCLASAVSLAGLAFAGVAGPGWPIKTNVFMLGLTNGAFAVAAIGSMMALAGAGQGKREGIRMGLWGAAQAIAFGVGGLAGAAASDLFRFLFGTIVEAYATVFVLEAMMFVAAAFVAARVGSIATRGTKEARVRVTSIGDNMLEPSMRPSSSKAVPT